MASAGESAGTPSKPSCSRGAARRKCRADAHERSKRVTPPLGQMTAAVVTHSQVAKHVFAGSRVRRSRVRRSRRGMRNFVGQHGLSQLRGAAATARSWAISPRPATP